MDPRVGVDSVSDAVIRMLFDGLAYMGRSGKTELALAESYEVSSDYQTYTFYLKEAQWSDGTPLTAHDFEATWKGMLDPDAVAPNSNLLYLIKNGRAAKKGDVSVDAVGVHAVSDRELLIELEQPHTTFLDALTNCAFYPLPPKMRESKTVNYNNYVSCGPFKLKEYLFQNKIIISKNPHYWNEEIVQLDEVHFYIVRDEATSLLMFKKGEVDWLGSTLGGLGMDALPELRQKGLLSIVPVAGTNWLEFNTEKFPFTNRHIRRALAMAIDRKEIVENLFHNEYEMALSQIPKIQKQELWHPFFKDNDREEAKKSFAQGLEELHIAKKDFPVVTILYNNSDMWHKMMQAIQHQWSEVLGIDVRIQSIDWGTYLGRLWKKDFEVARFGWRVQYNDPSNLLEVYKYKDFLNNHTGWENPEFINYIDQASRCLERSRWAFLDSAEKILMEEMPIIPICHSFFLYIQKEYVKDVYVSSLNTADFRWAHIEDHL
jgi:oligopeptide transport system substrate-binding protein